MGLDMYLTKKTYIGAEYEHRKVKVKIEITVGDKSIVIDPKKLGSVSEAVGYWRKANQIHKWFVDNAQDGVDECQETEVDKEKLQELLDLCRRVVATAKMVPGSIHTGTTYSAAGATEDHAQGEVIGNPDEVAEILPAHSGFFFGGTDYDEGYMQDVKDTIEILEALDLDSKNYDVSYRYRASW